MNTFASFVDWITENESFLSGLAAIIVLAGVILSPIGLGIRRLLGGGETSNKTSNTDQPSETAAADEAALGESNLPGQIPDQVPSPPGTEKQLTLKDLTAPSAYPTEFAKTDGTRIAYNQRGTGPPNILLAPGIISHLNIVENLPPSRDTLAGLAHFAHVVQFDKRGQGLSDPTFGPTSLEERCLDMKAVLDAAGLERVFLVGVSEAGPMCVQFAHTFPERVQGLALIGSTARFTQSEDFPIGIPMHTMEMTAKHWGKGVLRGIFFPSITTDQISDETYRAMEHLIAPRDMMRQAIANMVESDVRHLLPQLNLPTLVIHFAGDMAVPIRLGRAMAEEIPGAEFLEINAVDHADLSQSPEALARIEAFCAEALNSPPA